MRIVDVIEGLTAAIVARVRPQHRDEVRAMLAATRQMYETAMQSGEEQAYRDGVKAEQEREAANQARGFDLGYRHGLEQAIGHVGSPARRVDDDEMTVQPS